ncbi:Lipoprotein-releasing system transmembrane protein LolE [Rosistilla ulvae]|uniref:Lipoprotein-releasing system transmembrane protein LolE n=1 Tax=Rosistilla ulvae TaxID=1930277 RepID=A0A517M3E4_9BACT|nr:FtsX-like permease family protein [Rosistilla ulvae]QDS89390.1 Lipoprotein-releasing system transmembrane protein LolE [Rosistilla ulvae]
MYRWVLCFRYLRTRYIALASIISVTLGVATLIVVNSVMAGFSAEMHSRMNELLSDVVIDCHSSGGMPDQEKHLERIRRVTGDKLVGTTCSVHVPAMLGIEHNGQLITKQINLIGVDPKTYGDVSDFGRCLLHPDNRDTASFELHDSGYGSDRKHFPESGWVYRRAWAVYQKAYQQEIRQAEAARKAAGQTSGPTAGPSIDSFGSDGMFSQVAEENAAREFDPEKEQFCGIILGITTCSTRFRDPDGEVGDYYYCRPGDDVRVIFPNAGDDTKALNQHFTVVDLYESGMSEYDSTFAFVPLNRLQEFRGMVDPTTGVRSITTIQLKLAEGTNLAEVRDALRAEFPPDIYAYNIQTWQDMQGPLLAAVRLETTILNVLLFLIIAVAGFGILATFFMIVVEKTRDIGILKALGASNTGVMSIFLSYGLLLGIAGSGVGLLGGLTFVHYINDIAGLIEKITGQEVFDPTVYYFNSIPTIIHPVTVVWVMIGAVAIAVMASVLPALRAARMHPVMALRYE